MKNKYKKPKIKIYLFLLCLIFILLGFFSQKELVFAQKSLEVNYPEIQGFKPTTTGTLIPDYVKYIFNFAIWIAGFLAIGSLIWGGIKYLTSTGDPGKLKSARDQILGAFWGIIILLSSYIILTIINPQLVIFQLPGLTQIPSTNLPSTQISPLVTTDLLGRIKEMAETIKKIPPEMKTTAEKIKELTNKCDCQNTRPACLCDGGTENSKCEAKRCYAGPSPTTTDQNLCGGTLKVGDHPCPDYKQIKNLQKSILAWRDEILYYKNRVLAEIEDLKDTIKILDNKISWYNTKISKEEEVLQQLQGAEREVQQRLIDYLKEEKAWLEQEKQYKNNLIEKLNQLPSVLEKANPPTTQISILPDQCFSNVETKCQGKCIQLPKYGCHDKLCGCQPDKCEGGNPCPTSDIEQQVSEINKLPNEIQQICDEIISIINSIKKEEARHTQF